jgi:hypothetical protein
LAASGGVFQIHIITAITITAIATITTIIIAGQARSFRRL